ncbi:MAG: 5'-methylthioadenosine/S-adenosylhomocysteine nucleosidase [Desulfobacteraceae bacterium]|nr:5'-methylthioadenosine/S-adenosylhomocysteine nucleosidase [Desulfobacteraceae bacterium]
MYPITSVVKGRGLLVLLWGPEIVSKDPILNQGTSGGHDPALHAGDIVLGVKSVNTAAMRTDRKEVGQGIDTGDWKPFNMVLGLRDSNDEKLKADDMAGDPALLEAAYAIRDHYKSGKVVKGVIGTADQWNWELDRLNQIRSVYKS